MKYGKKDVYPVKRKRNWVVIPVLVLVLLIGSFLLLFTSLQKYIVYGQGRLQVVLPFMEEEAVVNNETIDTYRPAVNASLVLDGYDYSAVRTDAGVGLSTMKAIYVPATELTDTGLMNYVNRLEINNANGLVLELKPQRGQLAYASGVEMARAYGLNGSFDLAGQVSALKERDIYLVADLACCVDDLLASRNTNLALKTQTGEVYRSEAGTWLDPYSPDVRAYLSDLCLELADMGFDEVLLTYAAHPEATDLMYSQEMTTPPDAVSTVSSFAIAMEKAVGDSIKLSLRCSADALRNGVGVNGQDMDLMFRVFDRVYCASERASIENDRALALSYMEEEVRFADRFVPIAYTALGDNSWLLLTWKTEE